MIGVEEAIEQTLRHTDSNNVALKTPLNECLGKTLANNIYSKINLPSFRNSAMDGYALLYSDYTKGIRRYKVVGEIPAGHTTEESLNPGEAFRIFTGAPLPSNSDLVIMQENTLQENEFVTISEVGSKANQNIRQIGEQVNQGELALSTGTLLTAASLGYLASLGIKTVEVKQEPNVAIVATGDELVEAGVELKFGQIYESNSIALKNALLQYGINNIALFKIRDDFENTKTQIQELLNNFEYVLFTGGISVGDYDYVGKALKELSVKEVFYKVKQKPGKPIFFGRHEHTHIFALPGNPAAALSCFYIYVLPSIRKYLGNQLPGPAFTKVPSNNSYSKKGRRAQFLKASVNETGVTLLEGQSSNMMHTFALANALVYLNEETEMINRGETVNTLIL